MRHIFRIGIEEDRRAAAAAEEGGDDRADTRRPAARDTRNTKDERPAEGAAEGTAEGGAEGDVVETVEPAVVPPGGEEGGVEGGETGEAVVTDEPPATGEEGGVEGGEEGDATDGEVADIPEEEAEVMVDEGERRHAEAEVDIERSRRLLEVSDGLEDLAIIAEQIEEVTPVERALIANSAQMAVAGTDITPEEIIPGLESMGTRPGFEEAKTLRERAADILKIIQATLERIWDGIVSFFRNLIGNGVILDNRLKKIKEALKGDINEKGEPISIGSAAHLLSVDGKMISNGGDLVKELTTLAGTVKWALETRPASLVKLAEGLGKALNELDFKEVKSAGDINGAEFKLVKDIQTAVDGQMVLQKSSKVDDPRWPNAEVQKGEALLGNVSLFARSAPTDDNEAVAISRLERIRTSEITLEPTSVGAKAVGAATVTRLTKSEMTRAVSLLEDIVEGIRKFEKEKGYKQIDAARKKLSEASKGAAAKWDSVLSKNRDLTSAHNQAVMKAALSMNLSFAKWSKDPIAGVIRHAMEVSRVVIALLSKNIGGVEAAAATGEEAKK